jgi:hypothetical protein
MNLEVWGLERKTLIAKKCGESVRHLGFSENAEQYQVLSTVNPVCVLKKALK